MIEKTDYKFLNLFDLIEVMMYSAKLIWPSVAVDDYGDVSFRISYIGLGIIYAD